MPDLLFLSFSFPNINLKLYKTLRMVQIKYLIKTVNGKIHLCTNETFYKRWKKKKTLIEFMMLNKITGKATCYLVLEKQ